MNSTWVCPIHQKAKVVPAGVSKTGKPYQAFMVCSERGCEERPPKEAPKQAATPKPIASIGSTDLALKGYALEFAGRVYAGTGKGNEAVECAANIYRMARSNFALGINWEESGSDLDFPGE